MVGWVIGWMSNRMDVFGQMGFLNGCVLAWNWFLDEWVNFLMDC